MMRSGKVMSPSSSDAGWKCPSQMVMMRPGGVAWAPRRGRSEAARLERSGDGRVPASGGAAIGAAGGRRRGERSGEGPTALNSGLGDGSALRFGHLRPSGVVQAQCVQQIRRIPQREAMVKEALRPALLTPRRDRRGELTGRSFTLLASLS